MKMRQLPDDTRFSRYPGADVPAWQPGDWCWYTRQGVGHAGIILCLPNIGHTTMTWPGVQDTNHYIKARWTFTGDGATISATPSLWFAQGDGKAKGEWHGWVRNGELVEA